LLYSNAKIEGCKRSLAHALKPELRRIFRAGWYRTAPENAKGRNQQKRSSWRMPDWFELGAKASELSKFLLCLTSPSAERHGDAHVYAFKRLILPCYEKHLLVLEHAVDMLAIGNRADKCPLAAINHDCDFRRRAARSNLR
jgi:hypothetical protein